MNTAQTKAMVRERYAKSGATDSNDPRTNTGCCGNSSRADSVSADLGYSAEDLKAVPDGANLGLGCGNPTAIATLQKGEVVLDLGSGGGFDAFLAARQVGSTGRVIGVDMTPEMIDRARKNASDGNYDTVEFRLGEIEHLPVADNSVDAIISNCVINLSPEKNLVFREAFRALKSGGRLMVSDIVLEKELPEAVANSVAAYAGCIAGASLKTNYLKLIQEAGFKDIETVSERKFSADCDTSESLSADILKDTQLSPEQLQQAASETVTSISVLAIKP